MRGLSFIIVLVTCVVVARAQVTFDRFYGDPYPYAEVLGYQATTEFGGDYWTVSSRLGPWPENNLAMFRKIGPDGSLLLQTTMGDSLFGTYPMCIAPRNAGDGFIVAGFRPSYTNMDTVGYSYLARYDLNGDTLWTRQFTISDHSFNFLEVFGMRLDADDNIYVAGTIILDTVLPYNDEYGQIFLMKADQAGNTIWEGVYGQAGIHEGTWNLELLPNGGCVVVGFWYDWYDFSHFLGVPFVVITDSDGDQVSYTELDDLFTRVMTYAIRTADNNIVLCGASALDNTLNYASQFYYEGELMKIDTAANVIWSRRFGGMGSETSDEFYAVDEDENGDLIVAGSSVDTTDLSSVGWIMKTDANGYLLWERYFNRSLNPANDIFSSVLACSDGGILATGASFDSLAIAQKIWLLKLDSLGCDSAGCPDAYHTAVPDLRPIDGVYLVAAPNPFKEATDIRWAWPAFARKCQLLVHDMSGRNVLRKELDPNVARGVLRFTPLEPGAYVASLVVDGKVLQYLKLVAAH
jgi:hypothetical protein